MRTTSIGPFDNASLKKCATNINHTFTAVTYTFKEKRRVDNVGNTAHNLSNLLINIESGPAVKVAPNILDGTESQELYRVIKKCKLHLNL